MQKISDVSVRFLKGIGPKRAEFFAASGICTIQDLLYSFPRRYEDRSHLCPIAKVQEGQVCTVQAEIMAQNARRSWRRRAFSIVEIAVADDSGKLFCVWFNQPYLARSLKPGMTILLHGKVERYAGRLQMSAPEFELLAADETEAPGDQSLNAGRIVPVYSLPEGLGQRIFRQAVKRALDEHAPSLADFLPLDIRARNMFFALNRSLSEIHFPGDAQAQKEAHRRLSFDEFFLFQVPLAMRKFRKQEKQGIAHTVQGALVDAFLAQLPFSLTASQAKVAEEIKRDMASSAPMHRLLQGDVGSGKTVVAAVACMAALQGGYQAAIMVPTEILARQHYEKIRGQAQGLTRQGKPVKVGLLTSSQKAQEKEQVRALLKSGELDIVIGTHALLGQGVGFSALGLVVIDEQHKFGVGQRALLPQKGASPDVLIMTATPIPRTLAITLYGDLDISVITELPPGRIPIKTMHFDQAHIHQAYTIAKEQMRKGYQAYCMYPVIEESFALDIQGAEKMYESFTRGEFAQFRIGLVHGKLAQKKQDEVMHKFADRQLDMLVATSVLEVGIDMPQATCMIIENAQRFGLSQLHQLRGRVGRGSQQSYCILVSEKQTQEAQARINAMVTYCDGFKIAEEDLKIRGPGEFFGARQHGLGELKLADPVAQMHLLKCARQEALALVGQDPLLSLRQHALLKQRLLQVFPEYEKLMVVG